MKKKILIVDDEESIVETLTYNLLKEDFEVISANDGESALKLMKEKPDLVLLDIMLPKLDGYAVCKQIRETKGIENTPVIFLTAKSSEVDEVIGMNLGANGYITKPISHKKLIAWVKSVIKNSSVVDIPPSDDIVISYGPVYIDRERYIVKIDGEEKIFPRKEFELLYFLTRNPGIVFTRMVLLKEVWGSDVFVVDRTVDVHIRKIREKIPNYPELIETIKGVGYRFKEFS